MRLRFVASVTLVAVACGGWPPAVSTPKDVKALPATTQGIRCIDCEDAALLVLAEHLEGLDHLFMNDQSRITDEGIRALSRLRSLRHIVISDASSLSDASMMTLADLPNLTELYLYHGINISSSAVLNFGTNTRLQRLYLRDFPHVNAVTGEALQQRLPNCEVQLSNE